MPDKKLALKGALEKLKKVTADLTSLEVMTYTGEVHININSTEALCTNFEDLLKSAEGTKGKLTLRYATKISFDGDGLVLVPLGAPKDHILKAHESAVLAGQKVRQGLLTLFSDVIESAIKLAD